jgi:hypothetical protein
MTTGITSTSIAPKFCSHCGSLLLNQYFDYGNGQRVCGLCHSQAKHNQLPPPWMPQSPSFPTPAQNHIDALNELIRLNNELDKAAARIAELESAIEAIRDNLPAKRQDKPA